MEAILHYDAEQKQFWFPYSGKEVLGNPFQFRRRGTSYEVTFSSRYPMSVIGARAFKALHPQGKATSGALEVINQMKQVPERISSGATVKSLERLFRVPPYAHQKDAIEHMMHYERLALLLEQGLGKTYISIMALMFYRELGIPHRALVVCPNIVFNSWLNEVRKFSDLKVLPYRGQPDVRRQQREEIRNSEWDIVLTTFDQMTDKRKVSAKSSNRLSMDVLKTVWRGLEQSAREHYVSRWSEAGILDEKSRNTLLTPRKAALWQTECAKILTRIPLSYLPSMAVRDARNDSSNAEFFKHLDFDNLIIDEASRCINHESNRSVLLSTLSIPAKRVYLLSGTLCVGRPTDMFMPMNILDPSIIGGDWYRFKKTYCLTSPHNKNIIVGYRNVDRLKTIIGPHILNKERSECLDLPDRIMMQRHYELSADLRKLYNRIVSEDIVVVNGYEIHTKHPLVKMVKCMQVLSGFLYVDPPEMPCNECDNLLACVESGCTPASRNCLRRGEFDPCQYKRQTIMLPDNPKLSLLEEDLQDNGSAKTIVWGWYKQDLEAISALLKQKKIPFITADTPDCARKFEENKEIRVFLGQTVQGIGITLNSASTTVYYSHGTALEPRLQSMDRNYRIGQTKSVVVKDYLCKGTIEESIVTLLSHKEDVKIFMQKNIECPACQKFQDCFSDGTKYLGANCMYVEERRQAEKKQTLKLREAL